MILRINKIVNVCRTDLKVCCSLKLVVLSSQAAICGKLFFTYSPIPAP